MAFCGTQNDKWAAFERSGKIRHQSMRKAFCLRRARLSAEFEGEKNRERDSRKQLALMICVRNRKLGGSNLLLIEICNYLLLTLLGMMHMQALSIHYHMVFFYTIS
jgi:hypothetical protein